ncbi:MAG: glucokinase [Candidatus Polarisedimenticolaceae bacterium]|nr:glucokinase [Candidatus Polarisedimenticolaceae bacterium]
MKILTGDIGGTNTRLAVFDTETGQLQPSSLTVYGSNNCSSLDEVVAHYISRLGGGCEYACFGIAGPIKDRHCKTTNLPWQVSAADIEHGLRIKKVWLINDLEAVAWGIPALADDAFCTLQSGAPEQQGNQCIIAAGTGLGEAGIARQSDGLPLPFATEGGHADFAPRSALEFALFEFLTQHLGHVSWERLLSGSGLVNIYHFLLKHRQHSSTLELDFDHPAATVSEAALDQSCPICVEALDLFIRLYGAEAGNLALKHKATGGVFIGGGIASRILPKLQEGSFLQAFRDKGRMEPLLQSMPVKVILDDKVALLGPGRYGISRL